MKKLLSITISFLVLMAVPSFGQSILTNTTLSAAITSSSQRTFTVASATNINAPSATDPTKATYLIIDSEIVSVEGVSGTLVTGQRGANGTQSTTHANSAPVFVLPAYLATFSGNTRMPFGACTRANIVSLPVITVDSQQGIFGSDCVGGVWVNSRLSGNTQPNGLRFPDPGGTAYTALQTSGTAIAANTQIECSEIDVPQATLVTGLGVLNGTTVGTDNHWVILYDASGNVLANSATAGALTANASTYQKFNFTAKYWIPGPSRYFACYGSNGTTDTVRHAITGTNDNILGGAVTGQVFGTAAAITAPSSFTTAKAPYFLLY